jgi:hypothetical protein
VNRHQCFISRLPFLAQIPDEALQLIFRETVSHPVEARAEIVNELLSRVHISDLLSKACGFLHAWVTSLQPQQISEWSKLDSTLRCCRKTGTVVIEAFFRSGDIPAELDRGACNGCGKLATAVQGSVTVCRYLALVLGDLLGVRGLGLDVSDSSWNTNVSTCVSCACVATHPHRT